MQKNRLYFAIIIFLIGLVFVFSITYVNKPVIGDEKILKEIDRLLLPVANQNITEEDFGQLAELVKGDGTAKDEVGELVLLAKYKEYSHIGHGLGFLYSYIQTGKEEICPGHSLAHYYVFMKNGETAVADDNFHESKEKIPLWITEKQKHNSTYLAKYNYAEYQDKFIEIITRIESGNKTASKEEITYLSDAPCI